MDESFVPLAPFCTETGPELLGCSSVRARARVERRAAVCRYARDGGVTKMYPGIRE